MPSGNFSPFFRCEFGTKRTIFEHSPPALSFATGAGTIALLNSMLIIGRSVQ